MPTSVRAASAFGIFVSPQSSGLDFATFSACMFAAFWSVTFCAMRDCLSYTFTPFCSISWFCEVICLTVPIVRPAVTTAWTPQRTPPAIAPMVAA